MAYTDREDLNYIGELMLVGEYETPFLNMAGGLGGSQSSKSFLFPLVQPYALTAASQSATSEALSAAAGTAVTVTRGQDTNIAQIMKKDVAVTYAKQSTTGEYSGIQVLGDQPVKSEYDFQKDVQFKQLAIDIDYSFLNGTFVTESVATTVQTTRGIIEACTTNTTAEGGATLTKDLIDAALIDAKGNGAKFNQPVMFVNGFQKKKISDIYGYAPADRTVGGVNVETIVTIFGNLSVVYAPAMPTTTVLIADMSVVSPVFVPHGGQSISYTDIGIVAAKEAGFWYTQIGLNYSAEELHLTMTGLASS